MSRGGRINAYVAAFRGSLCPPVPAPPLWQPKNEEILQAWPRYEKEFKLTKEDWERLHFPFYPLESPVATPINTVVWHEKTERLAQDQSKERLVELLRETGSWLVRGASSHVSGNGLSITRSENWLPNPRETYP